MTITENLTLTPGALVGGLQVEQLLGRSPNSATYLVSDPELGQRFTLKEFLPERGVRRQEDGQLVPDDDTTAQIMEAGREQFLLEGQILASLDHSAIIGLVRFFRANGTAYLLMPYEERSPLSARLQQQERLPISDIRSIFRPIAEALTLMHKAGIRHLDIRPENIYLRKSGQPLLLNFSMAAQNRQSEVLPLRDPDDPYAALEQTLTGGEDGPATDIYALAASLYHCFSGQAPPTAAVRQQALKSGEPDPLPDAFSARQGESSEGLAETLAYGLSVEAGQRPQSVEEWLQPLTSLDWRQSVGKTKVPAPEEGREWLPPMLAGAVLAVIAVIALYLVFSEADEPVPVETTQLEQPERPQPVATEETRRWQVALKADTVLGYREFLNDYPESVYVEQAGLQIEILDNKAWDELSAEDTREAYSDYLEQFPLGLHEPEALQRIDAMDKAAAAIAREKAEQDRLEQAAWELAAGQRSIASMDQYLQDWPDGVHADQAREIRTALLNWANDRKAFEAARSLNTLDALQAYIDAFPRGEHVATALDIMDLIDLRPGKKFRDCPECPEMVVVPAGTFKQGSGDASELGMNVEKPQRTVTIDESFAVGIHEVTLQQWDACVADGGCPASLPDNNWGRGRRPAIMVSWNDAQTYLSWLSERTGQSYRLPSESEWEYVARAGESSDWLGGDPAKVCEYGNIAGAETDFRWQNSNCADAQTIGTAEAGSFKPNAFGLYDVIGNVAEWTADCMNLSYLGAPVDGSAWGRGICSSHMTRGGSWVTGGREIRLPARFNLMNGDRNDFTGLRVIRIIDN